MRDKFGKKFLFLDDLNGEEKAQGDSKRKYINIKVKEQEIEV